LSADKVIQEHEYREEDLSLPPMKVHYSTCIRMRSSEGTEPQVFRTTHTEAHCRSPLKLCSGGETIVNAFSALFYRLGPSLMNVVPH
jgi:hypothetical protein